MSKGVSPSCVNFQIWYVDRLMWEDYWHARWHTTGFGSPKKSVLVWCVYSWLVLWSVTEAVNVKYDLFLKLLCYYCRCGWGTRRCGISSLSRSQPDVVHSSITGCNYWRNWSKYSLFLLSGIAGGDLVKPIVLASVCSSVCLIVCASITSCAQDLLFCHWPCFDLFARSQKTFHIVPWMGVMVLTVS